MRKSARKEHVHGMVSPNIFKRYMDIWKSEAKVAVNAGDHISKSEILERLLKLGIEAYERQQQ